MTNPITHCAVCGTHWSEADVFCDGTCAACLARQVERLRAGKHDRIEEAKLTKQLMEAKQEAAELRAELAAEAVSQPCGHAAKWLAYRNAVDLQSERYCLFCEIERLREQRDAARQAARGLYEWGSDLMEYKCNLNYKTRWPWLAEEDGDT